MSRFDGGWVKVYRELLETDIANNPTRLSLFVHLIAMANVEDSWVEFKSKPRICPRGSLVTSHRELCTKTGASRSSVDRQLKYLSMRDTLVVESETRGTFITIKNYSDYQDVNASPGANLRQSRGAKGTTGGTTDEASNEETKKLRKEEVAINFSNFKKPNSSELFAASQNPETIKFKEFFKSKSFLADFEGLAPNFQFRFKTFDVFNLHYEGLTSGDKFKAVETQGDAIVRKYISSILMDEVGLSRKAQP